MATKTATKKTAKKKVEEPDGPIEILHTIATPLEDLVPYYKNPRIGNVDEIAKSLHINGQYKPIVVNVGTKTGRPNEVLAGNHTMYGAEKEIDWAEGGTSYEKRAWTHIIASYVDVDEARAAAIVLADNKTAELGTFDDKALAELLNSLPTIAGTGFDQNEAQSLIDNYIDLSDIEADTRDLISGINFDDPTGDDDDDDRDIPEVKSLREQRKDERGEEGAEADAKRGIKKGDDSEDKDIEDISVSQELQVVLETKEDTNYKEHSEPKYNIPMLREDMLVESIPDKIQTWAGRNLTPDDGKKTFLYTIGNGSRPALPFDRSILAFWSHDEKFENWWDSPAYFVARYMAGGITRAIVPDFSYYGMDGKVQWLWNAYRAQWLGRFFQDAGMKVIPRFQFPLTSDDPLDVALLGIPTKVPVIAIEIQNFSGDKEVKYGIDVIKQGLKKLDVGTVLLYGTEKRCEMVEAAIKHDGKVVKVENYFSIAKRDRDARTPKGAKYLSEKKKKTILEKHGLEAKKSKKKGVDHDDLGPEDDA